MSRVTMALCAPPAAGKTTLMMFLIQNLIRIGAIDWEVPLGDTYRQGEAKIDHSKGIATETYDLEIDFDKVVDAITLDQTGIHLEGELDNRVFDKETVMKFAQIMLEGLDPESIDATGLVTVSLERRVP